MNLRIKKLRRISISSLILIFGILLSSVALGAIIITKDLNNTITVIKQGTIELYEDSQATTIINTLSWGDGVTQGSTIQRSIWIKNIGDTTIYVSWNNTALPDSQCTLTLTKAGITWDKNTKLWMDATWCQEVVLTLHIDSNTIPNSYLSIITFSADDTP